MLKYIKRGQKKGVRLTNDNLSEQVVAGLLAMANLDFEETVGKKREVHNKTDSIISTNTSVTNNPSKSNGQLMIGVNLNFVGMIGGDVSIGLLFDLDDSSKSGLFLSGGFAADASAGVSIFGGYNSGKMNAENLGTISLGFGPIGANLGIDSNADLSFTGGFSPIGLDAGFNISKQHMLVIPFATQEEKNKLMARYYEHH